MTTRINITREFNLSKHTVAILATDDFEESELSSRLAALKAAGATVKVVSVNDSSPPFVVGQRGAGPTMLSRSMVRCRT